MIAAEPGTEPGTEPRRTADGRTLPTAPSAGRAMLRFWCQCVDAPIDWTRRALDSQHQGGTVPSCGKAVSRLLIRGFHSLKANLWLSCHVLSYGFIGLMYSFIH